jgi:hypothetical protein
MLTLKISVEPNEQDNDAKSDKGRTKWFSNMSKMQQSALVRIVRRIEAAVA